MKDFTVKLTLTVTAETMQEATTTVINSINGESAKIEAVVTTEKSKSRCDGCKVGDCYRDCPWIGCDDYC